MCHFIDLALEKAWAHQGLTYPNPPVGAVITDDKDNFISYGTHKRAGEPHAEVIALKLAYFKITNDVKILKLTDSSSIHDYLFLNHNGIFKNKHIYVTLEPCNHFGKTPPCSNLIAKLGLKKVIIGTLDTNKNASGGVEYLEKNGLQVKVLKYQKCKDLLEPFTLWQSKRFIFFKLAMSNNGTINSGTITCRTSRELVHKLRDRCDLLVIGGNTVRVDRPTLDARHCDGKAPDILIYSKSKEFDKNIPLFGIPNRRVYICDNFDICDKYRFVMVEGGEGMLRATQDILNYYLIFRSPNFKIGNAPKFEIELKEIYSNSIGEDRLTWYKR